MKNKQNMTIFYLLKMKLLLQLSQLGWRFQNQSRHPFQRSSLFYQVTTYNFSSVSNFTLQL